MNGVLLVIDLTPYTLGLVHQPGWSIDRPIVHSVPSIPTTSELVWFSWKRSEVPVSSAGRRLSVMHVNYDGHGCNYVCGGCCFRGSPSLFVSSLRLIGIQFLLKGEDVSS